MNSGKKENPLDAIKEGKDFKSSKSPSSPKLKKKKKKPRKTHSLIVSEDEDKN